MHPQTLKSSLQAEGNLTPQNSSLRSPNLRHKTSQNDGESPPNQWNSELRIQPLSGIIAVISQMV